MENTKTLHALDEFAKTKPKDIPKELDDYLRHVAASGDPVYQWSLVKCLFRQKLLNVIMEFFENCPMMDIAPSPNLDPFNYETNKKRLLDRYDMFPGVPFTIQRIAELLTAPKKQYSRLDKYMRALEKNIWVVSTREPGSHDPLEQTTFVNGVLPSVLHPNSEDASDERLERQTEAFDAEDEEEQEPGDKSECVQPLVIEENSQQPTEAPSEAQAEPVPIDGPVEPITVPECNAEIANILEQKETLHPEVKPALPASEHVVQSKTEESSLPEPKLDQVKEEAGKEEVDAEEPQELNLETVEKTEEIFVTEIDNTEGTDEIEELIEPGIVSEPFVDDKVEDEESHVQEEEKVDLKRKIDEVIEEEEDAVPNKKLTESPPELNLPGEEKPLKIETAIPQVEVGEVDEIIEEETVAEVLEITEVEGAMESDVIAEPEEKVEMVVEEPEQAMEVDESSAQSAQSPMAQEDVTEPMEESELVTS